MQYIIAYIYTAIQTCRYSDRRHYPYPKPPDHTCNFKCVVYSVNVHLSISFNSGGLSTETLGSSLHCSVSCTLLIILYSEDILYKQLLHLI